MPPTPAVPDHPSLDARYDEERLTLLAARLRLAAWLVIVLVPAFGILDWLVHAEHLWLFLPLRVAMTMLAALLFPLLATPLGRRHVELLSVVTVCQVALGVALMNTQIGGDASPYYPGINLVILATAVLLPWELGLSLPTIAFLIIAYGAVSVSPGGVTDLGACLINLFFVGSTGLIAVVSHHAGSQVRRRDLRQRIALEAAGRHREEFLANVTHELRTPLAAIMGFAEMLADYATDATPAERGWLARIRENSLTLYRLIVQLLDFSRIEAGALELSHEPLDLGTIVRKVAEDMRAINGEGSVELAVDGDVPPLRGDAGRVEEIVTNLAANAIKFSGGHPITLAVRAGAVDRDPAWHRIVPAPGPDAALRAYGEVAIIDRGEGIAGHDLSRLFVAFQQLDGSSTRRQGGTGLGLAISARLAAAMRGHIAVHSVPGRGSTFALVLPEASPDAVTLPTGPTAATG